MKHHIYNASLLDSPNLTAETYPVCRRYPGGCEEWNQTFTHSRYPGFMFCLTGYPKERVWSIAILDPDVDEETGVTTYVGATSPQAAMVQAVMVMQEKS